VKVTRNLLETIYSRSVGSFPGSADGNLKVRKWNGCWGMGVHSHNTGGATLPEMIATAVA